MTDLKRTPLFDLHVKLGGKMVPFAGWEMPVQYPVGVMKEHLHTRALAGLFDVSHMAQLRLKAADRVTALESLMPVNVAELKPGRQRYGLLTAANGGILDDLMFANMGDWHYVVVNAARADHDIPHISAATEVEVLDRALLALQGPAAEAALATLNGEVRDMKFMDARTMPLIDGPCIVTRSGYTGEDGFEISVPKEEAVALAEALLEQDGVEPIGLGARDSLRLEAGLCLYGNDIDTETTPVEADLIWAMQKRRRENGGFPGADVIQGQLSDGPTRKRVGLRPEGRAPVRQGVTLHAEIEGPQIGVVTSGGFGPSVGGPVAMGYLPTELSTPGTTVFAALRGKFIPLAVAETPFVQQTYKR
ncbi:glycine cleavage system aminomethyltransferase GcvT [Pontivivens insulae]|uniref:aminomethyltransferase n=1 Tax=Pontivivens insulae TaxID=1639689 RepID=A0A2R8AEG1_9RHOB|nr:glycine cleavage system aminomethyltransferase GcvT [Pontivivens insulae]RED11895.1 aminomethyltransferase [Pontivivens insulae]SPF30651.1 Aminomethyltransferase [Pontivivens insulae]